MLINSFFIHCDCNSNLKDDSSFTQDATKKDNVIYVIFIAEAKTLKKGVIMQTAVMVST